MQVNMLVVIRIKEILKKKKNEYTKKKIHIHTLSGLGLPMVMLLCHY